MLIRKTRIEELDQLMKIYEIARLQMASSGNPKQWGKTQPTRDMVEKDILNGHSYVGVFEDGNIHCCFSLIDGEDPTYLQIEGAWLNDEAYMTVHRIASDGKYKGLFKKCMDFCKKKSPNIRIDTHKDNAIMRHLIKKNGFVHCGTIYLKNGSPRLAYHYCADE